jgi:hypothetical protein
MKIIEKFKIDVQKVIKIYGDDDGGIYVYSIPKHLRVDWPNVHEDNVIDTVRAAGFTVIGNRAYGLDV